MGVVVGDLLPQSREQLPGALGRPLDCRLPGLRNRIADDADEKVAKPIP
jgi:hypothetical protein